MITENEREHFTVAVISTCEAYFNVSVTSWDLQTPRLEIWTTRVGLNSAGANVSVSRCEGFDLVSVSSFNVSCRSLRLCDEWANQRQLYFE